MEDLQTTDHVTGERLLIKGEKLLAVREINGNCCELTLESSGGCIEALRVREGYGSLAQKLGIDLKPEGLEDLKGENWIKMDRLLKRYV